MIGHAYFYNTSFSFIDSHLNIGSMYRNGELRMTSIIDIQAKASRAIRNNWYLCQLPAKLRAIFI